jgi:hydroxymethylglutaryl-CoA lyase
MRILEVGPRDGLQNEPKTLSLDQREQLIHDLLGTGLDNIEVGSFVKKGTIPQLADTPELVKRLMPYKKQNFPDACLWAFVPNEHGLEAALSSQIDAVAFFCATSESFVKKNINRSFDELRELLTNLKKMLPKKFICRVYLSTIVHCPFEGKIKPDQVFKWVDYLLDLGFNEIALSDTTGHAHPKNLRPILEKIKKKYSVKNFSLHFHDTRGTALLNTHLALDYDFKKFDSSLGALGGCPYAPGATGNLGTEDLVYLLQSEGKMKNISLEKIAASSKKLQTWLGKELPSRVLKTFSNKEPYRENQ